MTQSKPRGGDKVFSGFYQKFNKNEGRSKKGDKFAKNLKKVRED